MYCTFDLSEHVGGSFSSQGCEEYKRIDLVPVSSQLLRYDSGGIRERHGRRSAEMIFWCCCNLQEGRMELGGDDKHCRCVLGRRSRQMGGRSLMVGLGVLLDACEEVRVVTE